MSRRVYEETTRSQGETYPKELEPSTHTVLGTMIVPTSHAGRLPDSQGTESSTVRGLYPQQLFLVKSCYGRKQ